MCASSTRGAKRHVSCARLLKRRRGAHRVDRRRGAHSFLLQVCFYISLTLLSHTSAVLVNACVCVQRAWRKKTEWTLFVQAEEKKALKEANRLKREYLYGGKSAAELRALRASALDTFEQKTSDLGRSKANGHLDGEAGLEVKEMDSFGTWMATLRS